MKLFLIDGHALIFKMYYAFLGRPMINTKGQDTSILFGFTKYILEMFQREQPTHVAVAFDPPGGTFRNRLYPEYKANRGETPQLVIEALEPLSEIVRSLGIPVLMVPGFEADDVIGSMAKTAAAQGFDVYMVTPDKDYGQLVEEHIFQYKPGKGGGESEILGPADICLKHGLQRPEQVIDLLALCGDSSDNVPGVQGVGPVGAAKLLSRYDSVEDIYLHLDELTARQKELFRAAQDHIGLSKTLVTIKTDIPLDTTVEDMAYNPVASPQAAQLLDFYEMRSLKKFLKSSAGAAAPGSETASLRFGPTANAVPPLTVPRVACVSEPGAAAPVVNVEAIKTVSVAELAAMAAKEGRVALAVSADGVCAAVEDSCTREDFPLGTELKTLLEEPGIVKCGSDLKRQMRILEAQGIKLCGKLKDTELIHYLLNPERNHSLSQLSMTYLGLNLEEPASEMREMSLFSDDGEAASGHDDSLAAVAAYQLCRVLEKELSANAQMQELYDRIEEPLAWVLAKMETTGVKIDLSSLQDFANGLRVIVARREQEVRELSGEANLNVSSPKQIGEVLFEKMKLDPKAKKPIKGNWPTDEETLLEIDHPIIDAILDYRGTKKLLNTYIEPFPQYVSPADGRVHTTFNQALTSTGRLSSSNPNLQNIPIRTEQGKEIRKAFTAPEGSVIMSADYSQIELRLMAHFCQDAHMLAAFREGRDVHSAMAAKIFHKPLEEVTPDDRRVAKTANFGIMYGISAFGLSQRLKCSRKEASAIIDGYFEQFPSIRNFIDDTLAAARENGYVETMFGRRRYVQDVNSHNGNLRALAERNAVNAPIQGSAADIIKLAMIGVDRALEQAGLKARMVLQIHDELVLEVPENEIDTVKKILVEQMEGVLSLSVPLTVECNYGKDWLQAH